MAKGRISIKNLGNGKLEGTIHFQRKGLDKFFVLDADVPLREEYDNEECEFKRKDDGSITLLIIGSETIIGEKVKQISEPTTPELPRRPLKPYAYNELWTSLENSYLPKDVRESGLQGIENYALKLNKATQWIVDHKGNYKAQLFLNPRREESSMILPDFSLIDFAEAAKRQSKAVRAIFEESFCARFELQPESAWITGLGTESVYETGLTLHHIYGTPYMPSSGIKGYLRSFLIEALYGGDELHAFHESKLLCDLFGCPKELSEEEEGQKKKRKKASFYARVFQSDKDKYGFEERQGSLVFFDLLPLDEPEIAPDIMNPHYPQYYGGKSLPVDYDTPVPITFLTVKGNVKYQTFIAAKAPLDFVSIEPKELEKWHELGIDVTNFDGDAPSAFIDAVFKKALTFNGIGAKTAVGYGYFS